MQPVQERGSIDKPLTFDVGLIQLSFILIHATFQSNCAEGLHFIITSKKNFPKLEKEYRDCIKRKWRQDWDMNETL